VKVNVLVVPFPIRSRETVEEAAGADAADVEERLQVWLKDNPNAQIEHVVQTPVSKGDGYTHHLLVTIFYREGLRL
jgi:hypothetical protein